MSFIIIIFFPYILTFQSYCPVLCLIFLDFISILIHLVDDQVDLGTKVNLKGTKCLFQLDIYSHKELFITQNLYQYHGP